MGSGIERGFGGGLGPRVRQEVSMNFAYFDAGFLVGAAARAAGLAAGFFGFVRVLLFEFQLF